MHSGYFWIDPDIRRPCFLGPCFKLFRIINELNRIRACRLPALSSIPPRTKTSFTSKFTTPGYLALPTYLPTYPRDKEQKETTRKRGRGEKTSTIRAQTDLFCHVGIKWRVAIRLQTKLNSLSLDLGHGWHSLVS